MCARAVEPTVIQKATILALKCITAMSGISVPQGATAGLIIMVIEASKYFNDMVCDRVPRQRLTVKRPIHVSLRELDIMGGGVLTLTEHDVGTEKTFFDITLV